MKLQLFNPSTKLRILNIIGSRHIYGAERSVGELVRALLQKGQEVDVLCSPEIAPLYQAIGARAISLIGKGPRHFAGAIALTLLQNRYDVIHLHGISASIVYALTPVHKRKAVMTLRGSEPDVLSCSERNWRAPLLRTCMTRTAASVHEITAVSTPLVNYFSGFGKKVHIIFNGVNVDLVRSTALRFRDSARWLENIRSAGSVILACPGRLDSRTKRQDIIIRALLTLVEKKVNCYLLLIGTGPDLNSLRSLAKAIGLCDRIFFLQYLPWGQALAHVACSDVVITHIVPHRFGGLSQVHLEAAALEKPIITMAHQDLEVLKDGLFFVESTDPEQLAENILYVLEHHNEAQQRASRAGFIAEREFSWERVAEKYLKLFLQTDN